MQSAKQQVIGLIHAYQAAVYQAVALINAKSERVRGFQRHQESPGVWAGYLDEEQQVRYAFHGAGCLVATPGFKVDFDYALAGGCTGLDPWFMVHFLKSSPTIRAKYPTLMSGEQVEQILQQLVNDGLLVQYPYGEYDRRYYLATDLQNSNLPTVIVHAPSEDEFEW